MAFSSPTKIPRVEGEEFLRIREKFCLLAVSIRCVCNVMWCAVVVYSLFYVFCEVCGVGWDSLQKGFAEGFDRARSEGHEESICNGCRKKISA